MAAGNHEVWQELAQRFQGLDTNGAVRKIAAATFPAAAGLDLNGACRARWGKEANQCYTELVTALTTGTMA